MLFGDSVSDCQGLKQVRQLAQTKLISDLKLNYFLNFALICLGVYAWIGINFVLGRFEHIEEGKCRVSTSHSVWSTPGQRRSEVF